MFNDDLLVRLEIKKTKYQTSLIMSEKKKLAILNVQTFLVQTLVILRIWNEFCHCKYQVFVYFFLSPLTALKKCNTISVKWSQTKFTLLQVFSCMSESHVVKRSKYATLSNFYLMITMDTSHFIK